jgi:hypothetical protein
MWDMLGHGAKAVKVGLTASDQLIIVAPSLVFNRPWPIGAPTAPEFVADAQRCQFDAEHARCLQLIDAFAAKSIDDSWPTSGTLGTMSGREWSRLEAKHLDHHLKQFSA